MGEHILLSDKWHIAMPAPFHSEKTTFSVIRLGKQRIEEFS